jgi:hypothetical protein
MLADPVLGWEGGMRPVIKSSTPGEEFWNLGLEIEHFKYVAFCCISFWPDYRNVGM